MDFLRLVFGLDGAGFSLVFEFNASLSRAVTCDRK
jgi:hypothetical protein